MPRVARSTAPPPTISRRTLARFRRVVRWQLVPTAADQRRCLVACLVGVAGARLAAARRFSRRLSSPSRSGSITRRSRACRIWRTSARCSSPRGSCGTAVTIALVLMHVGLGALAAGWVVTQAVSATACGIRLRRHFAQAWPPAVPGVSWPQARELFARSTWVSVAQIGQVLLNGSDVLILGALLGPAATVPYACTGKLVSVLANHPQLLMQTAAPALAEMRASASRTRLLDVALALMRAMLVISGGVACLVLTLNADVRLVVGRPVAVRRHVPDGRDGRRHAAAPRHDDHDLHALRVRPRTTPVAHDRRLTAPLPWP